MAPTAPSTMSADGPTLGERLGDGPASASAWANSLHCIRKILGRSLVIRKIILHSASVPLDFALLCK